MKKSLSIIALAAAVLFATTSFAQVARPRPADSTGNTYSPPVAFVIPATPPRASELCGSGQVYSGGTCVALTSGGGSGSFCGSARGNNVIVESVFNYCQGYSLQPVPAGWINVTYRHGDLSFIVDCPAGPLNKISSTAPSRKIFIKLQSIINNLHHLSYSKITSAQALGNAGYKHFIGNPAVKTS